MSMAVLEEYQAVRTRAGLIDASFLGVVRVSGADRVAFLHNLLTQDIKGLAPGSAAEAALVTPAGKLISDMVVWAETDAHWMIMPRARVPAVIQALEHYLITEDVALQDDTDAQPLVALQGPASADLLNGVGVHAVAHSLTGSPGFLLMGPAAALDAARVGGETLDVLRIEAGIPWFGVDMDETNLLPETGLQARAVSEHKGCYVGQEVIARMTTYGSASRKLMGLVCEGTRAPARGGVIVKDAEPIGAVTSACVSPALQKPIAMGCIKRPHYEPGARVTILGDPQPIPALLTALPFVL